MNDLGELLMMVVMAGGFAVLVGGAIALVFWMRKRNVQKWQAFAAEHGLQCPDVGIFGRPEITGRFREHQIHVYIYTTGGKNKSTYTVTKVMLNQPPGLGMRVYKEGFFSKIGKAIGTQDIQTGDAAFDEVMMVKGNDEVGVTEYLTPELRAALMDLLARESQINFDDSGAQLTMHGWVTDPTRLGALMDAMERVCSVADGNSTSTPQASAETFGGAGWTAEAPAPPPEPAGVDGGGFRMTTLPVDLEED